MSRHTIDELRQWQALPLSIKVRMTQTRIRGWIDEYGEDGVYIAYSGGKDSTVLSHIVDSCYPDNEIPRVFCDTGLEYPEIREFVKKEPRAVWLKPRYTFKEVIERYGYPWISKEVSECVYGARKYLDSLLDAENLDESKKAPYKYFFDKLVGEGDYANAIKKDTDRLANSKEFAEMLNKKCRNHEGGQNLRLAMILGMADKNNEIRPKESIPQKDKSKYAQTKYKFFLEDDAPIISSMCCNIMKKYPAHDYSKKTGRHAMTAEMASESRLRTQKWLQNGCNGFDLKIPKSTPMAFWTEQDVLLYIKTYNIEICSVYGDVVSDNETESQLNGQMSLNDYMGECGGFDVGNPTLKTTGCQRTGCMFCGYGCHLEAEGEGRFELMRQSHPKVYDYIMRPKEEGGLNYKEVIDWINEHGNLHIRY